MENIEDFHIKYWGTQELDYWENKPRSIRRKIIIVLSFLFILSLLPLATLGYTYLKNNPDKQVSQLIIVAPTPTSKPEPTKAPTISPSPAKSNNDIVIKGDSYWRISKRNCGTGMYYLSIANQNGSKDLHEGDNVIVNCHL